MGFTVRVGLLGCGTVGEAFAELLGERRAAIEEVTGVCLDLVRIAVRNPDKPRSSRLDKALFTGDAYDVVKADDIDVVVELIGGTTPVGELLRIALSAGKPVVSGNKELIASDGPGLFAAAEQAGVDIFFEAAAVAAVPILRPMRESLIGEEVTRVVGIVNGTTNYMLTRMTADRVGFAEALAGAQALGYAEPDATADVEGMDAASKLAILASLAFNQSVLAADVAHEGITRLEPDDFELAARFGFEIKLLAYAEREASGPIAAAVFPALVDKGHPLASVRDSFNAVFVDSTAAGELMFYGHGAGPRPTASAVLGDLVMAADHLRRGTHRRIPVGTRAAFVPVESLRHSYYLRVDVAEAPGVLSEVTGVFAGHHVSIKAVEQLGSEREARVVFLTFPATGHAIQAAIAELRDLASVREVGQVLRIFR